MARYVERGLGVGEGGCVSHVKGNSQRSLLILHSCNYGVVVIDFQSTLCKIERGFATS